MEDVSVVTLPASHRKPAWRCVSADESPDDVTGMPELHPGGRSDPVPEPARSSKPPIAAGGHILVVEDNRADVFLIREALGSAHVDAELHIVSDGDKAIRFFAEADDQSVPSPALIILDINLPKRPGGEVLQQLRKSKSCSAAMVVVVTSSDSEQDRARMARFGANVYFRKSSQYVEYMKLGEVVRRLLEQAKPPQN